MKGPSLQKTAALSAVLHVTFFLLTALILRQTSQMTIPSPYIVSLVGPVNGPLERIAGSAAPSTHRDAVTAPAEKNTTKMTTMKKDEKVDQKRLEDKIAEIESEIASKKKVERLASLRKKMVSIGGVRNEKLVTRVPPQTSGTGAARSSQGAAGTMSYEEKIRNAIHDQWQLSNLETPEKNLETIISVKIKKDGSIPLQNIVIEKKSGNRFFDREAIRAIVKASPVSPPPYGEMEIGIRFYP
jgi:TonB family protein